MGKDNSETTAEEFFPNEKASNPFVKPLPIANPVILWKRGTQTVFGEGARRAAIVFVGEQPGNE